MRKKKNRTKIFFKLFLYGVTRRRGGFGFKKFRMFGIDPKLRSILRMIPQVFNKKLQITLIKVMILKMKPNREIWL